MIMMLMVVMGIMMMVDGDDHHGDHVWCDHDHGDDDVY